MEPMFSILVVCLNPGNKLKETLQSIAVQEFKDYEIIIKDGFSTDGSLDFLKKEDGAYGGKQAFTETELPLRLVEKKDSGIYDAMNQALQEARGKYVYFLNCGDLFAHPEVLTKFHALIMKNPADLGIYYGNICTKETGEMVPSNPQMDAFGCYRNVPCHQACFYDRKLLLAHPFETKYRVRADYEHFLWCFFARELEGKVSFTYGNIITAYYESGGFSERKENKKVSDAEHRQIVRKYMSAAQIWKYRMILWITLAPLRTWLAKNPRTSGYYNKLKKKIYEKG
ncbi:MAG: glycosyltransferase [Roseburia sp.]|nr:glycosyltransferase [Ruminococcus sp.]MCM1154025.1 glycosyltransferase [Roseburia sp.]MCM1241714.1 glycosyltransferase [Roseburia sp.]